MRSIAYVIISSFGDLDVFPIDRGRVTEGKGQRVVRLPRQVIDLTGFFVEDRLSPQCLAFNPRTYALHPQCALTILTSVLVLAYFLYSAFSTLLGPGSNAWLSSQGRSKDSCRIDSVEPDTWISTTDLNGLATEKRLLSERLDLHQNLAVAIG